MRPYRSLAPLGALLLLLLSASVARSQPTAGLRVVHGLVAGPSVSVYVDSISPAAIPFISYGEASAVVSVPPGMHHITVALAGQPVSSGLFDTLITVSADSLYTTFVLGSVFSQVLDVITVVNPRTISIPVDSAHVRIMNGSSQVGPLTVTATPDAGSPFTETNIPYKGVTPYHPVKAAGLTLLLAQGSNSPFYKALGYPIGSYAMTVLVAGDYDPNDLNNFLIYALVDNDTNAQTPILQFSRVALEQGGFRAIHVAAGFEALDLFRDNLSSDSTPIGYRFAGARRTDLLGPHNFKVSRQGTGQALALLNLDLDIRPDTTSNFFILGDSTSLFSKVLLTPKSVVADPTRSPIRMLHASPDAGTVDFGFTLSDGSKESLPGMSFQDATRFYSFINGAATFNVYRTGQTVPMIMFAGEIPPEVVVTAILTGRLADTSLAMNLFIETDEFEQEPMVFLAGIASVEGTNAVVTTTTVVPNPARESARISFNLKRSGRCVVAIYDGAGRRVATLTEGELPGGRTDLPFSTAGMASGRYTVVVTGEGELVLARGNVVIVR